MKHKQEPQSTKNTITIFYESHSKPVARKIMKKSIDLFKKIGIKAFAVEEAQDIDVQVKYEESKSKIAQNLKVIINLKQMIGIRVNSEGKLAGVKTHLISC